MKLSDFVIDFFAKQGIAHAFVVSGGAVVHLIDSVSKNPNMSYVCSQHEEHCGSSADMYARVTRNLGLAMTTSGPGATNLVTSVCNAYFDSVPLICITGQVATFRLKQSSSLRQRGFQETDVVSIFKSITKYTVLIKDPLRIRYELEKAVYLAKSGRPGPVVIDIPDDIQRVDISLDLLDSFKPEYTPLQLNREKIMQLNGLIDDSNKPIVIFGAGVHIAKVEEEAREFVCRLNIPAVTTWGAKDLFIETDKLNMGTIGACGPRAGNFAVQNADLVIALGTRLSQLITGGKQNLFAPKAKIVMIDIDNSELEKFDKTTVVIDLKIQSDLGDFFAAFEEIRTTYPDDNYQAWRQLIKSWKSRYPICLDSNMEYTNRVNPYLFLKEVSKCAQEGDIIIADTGANLSWTSQAFEVKKDQRIFSAWNHTPMGYSLPAAVGASFATKNNIICFIGDGGLMMCLQELATARRYNLPIKIFIFDNQGHGIQKQTLDTWLASNYCAVDEASGLSFPDYSKLADAFSIPFYRILNHDDMLNNLNKIWSNDQLFICSIDLSQNQKIVPMLKFGAGLDDLDPKLEKLELDLIKSEAESLDIISVL